MKKDEKTKPSVTEELLTEAIKSALPALGNSASTEQIQNTLWEMCEADKNEIAEVMWSLGYKFHNNDGVLEWQLQQ